MDSVDAVIGLLSHDTISHYVDEPIDQSLVTFQYDINENMTHDRFNRIITSFVAHLFQTALRMTVKISTSKVMEEAIWILEQKYQGDKVSGYEAAFLDAVEQNKGIAFVLERMKELIKSQEREKYISRVYATQIDPYDWNMHVRIVETFLERYGQNMPVSITSNSSLLLARQYKDLITLYISTQEIITPLFV